MDYDYSHLSSATGEKRRRQSVVIPGMDGMSVVLCSVTPDSDGSKVTLAAKSNLK